jgi:hypothetical protein
VAGPPGPQGAQGVPGAGGPQGIQGPPGTQGARGPEGAQGTPGADGPPGTGLDLKGSVDDFSELPPAGQQIGETWLVADTGHLWFWNGTEWIDAGTFQGPAGPQGPQGLQGPGGPAGATGATGVQGVQGPAGPAGPDGPIGATGEQGVQGATGSQGPQGAIGPQGPAGPPVSGARAVMFIPEDFESLTNPTTFEPIPDATTLQYVKQQATSRLLLSGGTQALLFSGDAQAFAFGLRVADTEGDSFDVPVAHGFWDVAALTRGRATGFAELQCPAGTYTVTPIFACSAAATVQWFMTGNDQITYQVMESLD